MSKKFDIISIFLMIVLIIILFFVIYGYFNGSSLFLSSTSMEVNHEIPPSRISGENDSKNSGETTILPVVVVTPKNSGESSVVNNNEIESGEQIITTENENSPTSSSQVPMSNPLIITSDSNISSKEKKEVLQELDQTLMELLEVVDQVKTVDETRLTPPEESEVQP